MGAKWTLCAFARSLILGWSDKVVAIVNQLCNANESEGGLPIVILSEQEKVRRCMMALEPRWAEGECRHSELPSPHS